MSRDGKIISACVKSREAYSRIADYIDTDELTPTGEFWWKQVEKWYEMDSAAIAVDLEILRERGAREAGPKSEMAVEWLDNLPDAPSPDNVAQEVLELKRMVAYHKMTAAFEEEWDYDKLLELTDNHHHLMNALSLDTGLEFADIDQDATRQPESLIQLLPEKVNTALGGGAERGTHVVLFAPVGVGKTMTAINMMAGWLKTGKRVLYLGNEEPVSRIAARLRCNLSGMNADQCTQAPEVMWDRVRKKGWQNLKMAQLEPGTPDEVESYIKAWNPDCLIIDQLRNLHGTGGSGRGTRAQSLDRIASSIRQVITRYSIVGVSIGQANAGEHGKPRLWLNTDDFDESRTGVPGAADVMIGLSHNPAMETNNQLAVSICKNKLTGTHEQFIVEYDRFRSRII